MNKDYVSEESCIELEDYLYDLGKLITRDGRPVAAMVQENDVFHCLVPGHKKGYERVIVGSHGSVVCIVSDNDLDILIKEQQ